MHTHTDLNSRLGALELDAMAAQAVDAGLEAGALQAGPQTNPPVCHYIQDGALEAARLAQPYPTNQLLHIHCLDVSDAALERSVSVEPMVTRGFMDPRCRHIDGALEASALQAQPHPTYNPLTAPGCHGLDDDASLEAAHERHAAPPQTRKPFPNMIGCV